MTIIRPVLEYAAPVWHHLINRTQAQTPAVAGINPKTSYTYNFYVTCGMTYNTLLVAEPESLSPVHTGDKVGFNTVDFVESR